MLDPFALTRPGTVLLDTARPDPENRWSWGFTAPRRVLTADTADDVPALLEAMEAETHRGRYVAGYLSYEAGYPLVDLEAPATTDEPVAWFGVYEHPHRLAPADVDRGLSLLGSGASVENVELSVSRSDYTAAIERVRDHIRKGDVYQINYTAPVHFRAPVDPRVLYRRLRQRQHVPYGAYLNLGDRQILSYSPELFFRRAGNRVITRPMKGTTQRGRTQAEDEELRRALAEDPKNRAENLMIVDLLRNDLSVCCRPGSVSVPDLFTTEAYDSVTQMTSTVEGRLQEKAGLTDLLQALFPCGSVTGAPKRWAMRLIRSLEPAPRGVYCGAVGWAGPETAVFNVAIRTAIIEGDDGRMGVGSGIVWDSQPSSEYEECALKTQFLAPTAASMQTDPENEDLRLIETMRFDGVRLPLLDRHAARMARSATYFGYPFDEDRFRRRVERAVKGRVGDGVLTVRVTLDRWGRFTVETTPVDDEQEGPRRVAVADERADRDDPLFYHKTTHRRVYEQALEAARTDGYDEALLLNGDGEVTEGTYSNVFVEAGESLWTPPVDSGLLAGVYRNHVLETQAHAEERVLTLDDLRAADAVYCCNAVRGWCEAVVPAVQGARPPDEERNWDRLQG